MKKDACEHPGGGTLVRQVRSVELTSVCASFGETAVNMTCRKLYSCSPVVTSGDNLELILAEKETGQGRTNRIRNKSQTA